MNRPLFLGIAAVLVIILVAVWGYIFLAAPETNQNQTQSFGELQFADTDTVVLPTQSAESVTSVTTQTTNNASVRQITTTPVAGFTEPYTASSSSTTVLRYVEAGTGHIYDVDLETGNEVRVSGTTIPLTQHAAITPDGATVLFSATPEGSQTQTIGTVTTDNTLSNTAFPERAENIYTTSNGDIVYTTTDTNSTLARAYDPQTNSTRTLFTIPFREATVQWGSDSDGPHLVHPHAAATLPGMVYSYTNGVGTRVPVDGFGLSAVGGDTIIYSTVTGNSYTSTGYTADRTLPLPITVIPEKCVFSPTLTSTAICGATLQDYRNTLPDSWYRGETVMSDGLWQVRPGSGSASLLSNIQNETGQTVDIINPQFNYDGTRLYFQNKIDQTVWVYDVQ